MNSPEFNDLFLGHKIQVNSGPIFQLNSPDFLKKTVDKTDPEGLHVSCSRCVIRSSSWFKL